MTNVPAVGRFFRGLGLLAAFGVCGVSALATGDTALDAAPAGLAPTTVTLHAILAAHDKAAGTLTPGLRNTASEDWTFDSLGVVGMEHLERSGTDYHSRIVNGPFIDEYGQFGSVRWHRDDNGFVSLRTAEDQASFFASRILEDAGDPKNDVSVAGITTGDKPAYVLKVMRPGYRHPEWLFYDAVTSLVVRVESVDGKRREVSTYGDYRATDGLTSPWHMHDSDGRTGFDIDWQRKDLAYGDRPDPSAFAPPHSTASIEGIMQAGPLPVQYTADGPVVRISVQGRGLDFLLNTDSADSVIDRDVARELNLPTFHQTTQLADGTPVGYRTIIEDASTGPMRLQHFAVEVEQFSYNPRDSIKVVGVLGYDFLAGNVFRLDNVNGTIDVLPAATFRGLSSVSGGIAVPTTLDDGVPVVTMQLGEGVSRRVILDDALPFTLVFGQFYSTHASDFKDYCDKCKHEFAILPFADEGTFGTSFELWATRVSHLYFGNADYQQVPIIATNVSSGEGASAIDAIVGESYLNFFDIFLDYPDDRIIIKPNMFFFKTFKRNAP